MVLRALILRLLRFFAIAWICCFQSPGCTIRLVFFCGLSNLFQDVDLFITSLRAGFQVYPSQSWVLCTQAKAVRYKFLGVESHFWVFCFFFWLIVWADGINKCDQCLAGGRGYCFKGLRQIPSVNEYFIICYNSTFIRMSHLYQEFCAHCIFIINDGRMGQVGVGVGGCGSIMSGCGWQIDSGYYLIVFWVFLLVLLPFVLSYPLSLFLCDQSMIAAVPISVFIICFLCLWFL